MEQPLAAVAHSLGGGKHLFDGFDRRVGVEHDGVRQSRFATVIDDRVVRPGDGDGDAGSG